MTKNLRALLAQKSAKLEKARAMTTDAEGSSVVLSDEDQVIYDALMSDLDGINASINREQRLITEQAALEGMVVPDDTRISGGDSPIVTDPRRGFEHFGQFASAVMRAGNNQAVDERLLIGAAAPTTYGSESVGADGGFLVPEEFSREIWQHSLEGEALLPLTENMPISGNNMTFPSDETTPWGTDGVRAYWEGEAAAATQTKPKIQPNSMRLKKLTALVPVSDELLEDASGLPAYLSNKTGSSIRFKTNDAIVAGDGAGKPLGFNQSAALVSQAKESGQTATTINATNIAKMIGRMSSGDMAGLRWMIHPDAFNQIILLTNANQPLWMPDFNVGVGGRLMGIPVILSQSCQTLGTAGDIYLVDLKSYRTLTKTGGVETATSMHLYFDAAATAFRAIFRIDGQPIVKNTIAAKNGSSTFSPYVNLATRA